MAKKVYKNKLEKEKAEKKEARRAQMQRKPRVQGKTRMEKIYEDMGKMSEQDMQNRLAEIAKRKEILGKEMLGRNGKRGQEEIIDKLKIEYEKLEREEKRLNAYPEVKAQIARIMVYRDKFAARKVVKLQRVQAELAELRNQEARAKQIDEELKKLEEYSEEFSKKQVITEEDKKENLENAKKWNSLIKEKGKLQGSKDNDRIEALKKEERAYLTGRSREDAAIGKCNLAWKLLLAGKSWDEISLISAEEAQKRQEKSKKEQAEEIHQAVEKTEQVEQQPENKGDKQEDFSLKLDEKTQKPTDKVKFADKHPRLAKIPGVKNFMEKREEAKEAKNLPVAVQKFEEKHPRIAGIPVIGKRIAEAVNKRAEGKQETKQEAPKQEPPKQEQEQVAEEPETKKTERDMFIEYLRESVGEGHKKQGKYAKGNQQVKQEPQQDSVKKDEVTR